MSTPPTTPPTTPTATRQRLAWEATKAAKAGRIDAAALEVVRRLVREPASPAADAKVEAFAAAFFARLGGVSPPSSAAATAAAATTTTTTKATTTTTTSKTTTLASLPRDALLCVMAYLTGAEWRMLAGASLDLCTATWPLSFWRGELEVGVDERTMRVLADAALFPDVRDGDRAMSVAVTARGLWLTRFVHRRAAATMLRARWLRAHLQDFNLELHAVSTLGPQPKHVVRQTLAPRFLEHDGDLDAVAVVSTLPNSRDGARGRMAGGDEEEEEEEGGAQGSFRGVAVHDVEYNDAERLAGDLPSSDEEGGGNDEEGGRGRRPQRQRKTWYLRLPFAARDVGTIVSPSTVLELRARRNLSPELGVVGTMVPLLQVMALRGRTSLVPQRGSPAGTYGELRATVVGRRGCMLLGRVMHEDEGHFKTEAFVEGMGNHGQAGLESRGRVEVVNSHASRHRAPAGFYEVAQETPVVVFIPVNALFRHCGPA